MRALIAKVEVATGAALLALCMGHFGWCQWSIPRHGQMTPHGFETAVCNWGTSLGSIVLGAMALLTLASGIVGWRVRSRTIAWWAAQLPAIAAWGWAGYGLIHTLLIYPG